MPRENTSGGTMTDEYIRSVISTRRLLSHTLNIISQQERTMRMIIQQERESPNQNQNQNQNQNTTLYNEPLNVDNLMTFFSPLAQNTTRTPSVSRTPSITRTRPNLVSAGGLSNRPSMDQIRLATRELSFSSIINPINNVCPISREAFNDDEFVMQIIPCGHVFSRDNLRVWFLTSVNCPMCRYDIRNYRNRRNNMRERRQITNTNTNTNTNTQTIDRIANYITNDILRQLETNPATDPSNNLLFEYMLLTPEITTTNTTENSPENTPENSPSHHAEQG